MGAPKGPRCVAIGDKYGKLTITQFLPTVQLGITYVLCRCDCGASKRIRVASIRSGQTKSCGCYSREAHVTHRMTSSAEYGVWTAMKTRCNNPKAKCYKNYGGRGIKICERWSSFENFLEDMGIRPSKKHTLDRIQNDGPYSPDNCRWATVKEQCRNKRSNRFLVVGGTRKTLIEWSEEVNIHPDLISRRLQNGWTDEAAVTIPVGLYHGYRNAPSHIYRQEQS